MERNEVLDRLKVIVTEHVAPKSSSGFIPADTCWFDGDKCPYGLPNGRFQDRPESICHLGGCNRLAILEEDPYDFWKGHAENEIEDTVEKKINNLIEKQQISLASEIKRIADDEEEGRELQSQILKLAADIINGQLCDQKIIRVNDIT